MRFTQQALLRALLIDFVVAGRYRFFHFEGLVQLIVTLDVYTDQLRIGRPDHGAIEGVHRGQQNIRQVFDMIEKLDARRCPGRRIDIGVSVIIPGVEHFAHGPVRGNRGMANFRRANGLDKLRGQHRVTLDALFHDKTRGEVAQPQRHGSDDEKARQGKPAHQIERWTPILAFYCCRCRRRSCFLFFQCLHRAVLIADHQAFSAVFRISVGGIGRNVGALTVFRHYCTWPLSGVATA
ncbi:hypothetical protein D3C76_1132010 [compost metagenome]